VRSIIGATEQADALHANHRQHGAHRARGARARRQVNAPLRQMVRPAAAARRARVGASNGFLVSANEMRKPWAEPAPAELVPQLKAEQDEYADACGIPRARLKVRFWL